MLRRIVLTGMLAAFGACTTVGTPEGSEAPILPCDDGIRVERVVVDYDVQTLATDRLARGRDVGLAEMLHSGIEDLLRDVEFLSPSGTDVLRVDINAFRLPKGGRWLSGSAKGNDNLGAVFSIERGEEVSYTRVVLAQLGAGDRSIGENYSANWALDNLVDMLSWEIAWQLSGLTGLGEQPILEAGMRDGVRKAIRILGKRGQLSYGEKMKYSWSGKLGFGGVDEGNRCRASDH